MFSSFRKIPGLAGQSPTIDQAVEFNGEMGEIRGVGFPGFGSGQLLVNRIRQLLGEPGGADLLAPGFFILRREGDFFDKF